MFHIYRKASTVLVWLGPGGPDTCLAAGIVNIYDAIENYHRKDRDLLVQKASCGTRDKKINVEEFLNDLGDDRLSGDGSGGFSTLGLVSMAVDGIADILGRAWLRRTWIIQEIAAASNVEFHCGRSVLTYDGFFHVISTVGSVLLHARSVILADEYDPTVSEHLGERPRYLTLPDCIGYEIGDDAPASFRESSGFTEVLHQLRKLVHDPARRIKIRSTQTELMLIFLVETVSRGFEVSVAADRVYSLAAMADAISSASWGLTHNKRTASSPQQLPVDYSVGFRDAVLRALKIRMNEIGHYYVAVESLSKLVGPRDGHNRLEDWGTTSVLVSMCTADSSAPSWLRLLEYSQALLEVYLDSAGSTQKDRGPPQEDPRWAVQDVMEPDTLKLKGKALGCLVVGSEGRPSRTWVSLPCPLGQEFETCDKFQEPVRALHQGFPDVRPVAGDGASLDETETGGERNLCTEQQTALNQTGTGIDDEFYEDSYEARFWSWQFPPSARDGDVVVVFSGRCALIRPSHGGRYHVVKEGLRVPVDSSKTLSIRLEENFFWKHYEDLDTFVLI